MPICQVTVPKILLVIFYTTVIATENRTTLKQIKAPKVEKRFVLPKSAGSSEDLAPDSTPQDKYLLPGDIKPIHYNIKFTFGLEILSSQVLESWDSFPFFGVVSIKIKALKTTDKVVLHAHDQFITVNKTKIKVTSNKTSLSIKSIQQVEENYQFLTIYMKKSLKKGREYTIVIPFSGKLIEEYKQGLLLGSHSNTGKGKYGSEKVYAEFYLTAVLEPDCARRVFPCFDEPQYKASFTLTVGHHTNYSTVLSNMPLRRTLKHNPMKKYWKWKDMNRQLKASLHDYRWEQFEKTPLMSTYLITFSVSNFTYVESPQGFTKIPVRTYVRHYDIDQAEYLSQITSKFLGYYEEYWNMSYPLPKLDQIVIQFRLRGFESWGHIIYDEQDILYDPISDILSGKKMINELVCHELTHQFFGDLVTTHSWDDVWLNEGFAAFMHVRGILLANPENYKDLIDEYFLAFVLSTWREFEYNRGHALSSPFDPSDILESFDELEYKTGALVIRMLFEYVGEKLFQKVLHQFLNKHSYANVDKDDLWAVFDADLEVKRLLGKDVSVKKLMDPWVTNGDYPVLTVERTYGQNILTVKQQPHKDCTVIGEIHNCKDNISTDESSSVNSEIRSLELDVDKTSWWLPLNIMVQGQETTCSKKWLTDSEGVGEALPMEHTAKDDQWVLFNAGLVAPYRVNYDARNWELLLQALKTQENSSIPNLSRAQLIEDGLAFGVMGPDLIDDILGANIKSYSSEKDFVTFKASLNAFKQIGQKLSRSPEFDVYQRYMAGIMAPTYERLGGIHGTVSKISRQTLLQQNIQMTVVMWSCQMRVPGCEEKALDLFRKWRITEHPDKENTIPVEVRYTSACVAMSHDPHANVKFLGERIHNARSFAERRYLFAALACSNDTHILTRLLEWSVANDSEISTADASWLLTSIAGKPSGYEAARSFLYSRTADIWFKFSRDLRLYLKDFIRNIIKNINKQKELDEFLQWRNRKENAVRLKELDSVIESSLKSATGNLEWVAQHKDMFIHILRSRL